MVGCWMETQGLLCTKAHGGWCFQHLPFIPDPAHGAVGPQKAKLLDPSIFYLVWIRVAVDCTSGGNECYSSLECGTAYLGLERHGWLLPTQRVCAQQSQRVDMRSVRPRGKSLLFLLYMELTMRNQTSPPATSSDPAANNTEQEVSSATKVLVIKCDDGV